MNQQTINKSIYFLFSGIAFILGLLVKYYFDLYRNKISKLQYIVTKAFLGASGADAFFGKVQVLYNNQPVQNLYLCNINLINTSNKDFKDVEITVWCDLDSIILVSNAQKLNTIKPLQFTSQYWEEYKNNNNKNLISTRREYNIPILNRDDSVIFSCLVTNIKTAEPQIYLDCNHQGLKIVPNFIPPRLIWGEHQDIAILWGIIISTLLIIPVFYFIQSKIISIIIVFILGVFSIVPGIIILKLIKKAKSLFR